VSSADQLRRYYWSDEDRLDAVVDGGGQNTARLVYDAAGDRVAKLGRGGESLTIGQFFSLRGRKAATKHVFVGATRLASKLLPPPGWDAPVPATDPATPPLPGCDPYYQPRKCAAPPDVDPKIGKKLSGLSRTGRCGGNRRATPTGRRCSGSSSCSRGRIWTRRPGSTPSGRASSRAPSPVQERAPRAHLRAVPPAPPGIKIPVRSRSPRPREGAGS